MNKKVIIACVAGLILSIGLIWALVGKSTKDTYCNVIPDDALLVARLAPMELINKNNVDLEDLMERLNVKKRNRKDVEAFLKSGVDVTKPLYVFVDDKTNLGVVFKISSASKFKEYLEDTESDVEKRDGLYWVKMPGAMAFCFDDDRALFYNFTNGNSNDDRLETLMEQKEEKSILGTKLYKELIDCKKSIAVNLDYSSVMDVVESVASDEQKAALSLSSALLPDCNLLLTMDVEGDALKFTSDLFPNSDRAEKQLQDLLSKYPAIKGDLIQTGLANPIGWMCFNVPGSKVMEFIKDIPGSDQVLSQIGSEFDIEGMLSSFDGDVTLSLGSFSDGQPELLMLASTVNNKYVNTLNQLVGKIGEEYNLVSDGGSDFHISQNEFKTVASSWDAYDEIDIFDEDFDDFNDIDEYVDDNFNFRDNRPLVKKKEGETIAYVGNQDNIFILTNNEALKNQATQKTDALKEFKDEIKGCNFYGYVNLAEFATHFESTQDTYSPLANVIVVFISRTLQPFSHITLFGKGNHGEMFVKTKNGKNFLNAVLDILDQK